MQEALLQLRSISQLRCRCKALYEIWDWVVFPSVCARNLMLEELCIQDLHPMLHLEKLRIGIFLSRALNQWCLGPDERRYLSYIIGCETKRARKPFAIRGWP